MNSNLTWILLLTIQLSSVATRPLEKIDAGRETGQNLPRHPNYEDSSKADNEQVISVRITSSVAVGRGKGKSTQTTKENGNPSGTQSFMFTTETYEEEDETKHITNMPPNLEGANIEYIKQLNAKKETKDPNIEQVHPFQLTMYQKHNDSDYINERLYDTTKIDEEYQSKVNTPFSDNVPSQSQDVDYATEIEHFESSILTDALKLSNERLTSNTTDDLTSNAESTNTPEVRTTSPETDQTFDEEFYSNGTDDSVAEPSVKSVLGISDKNNNENYENIENVPLARSVLQSPSSKNYIQGLANKPPSERESSTRLTTVSFNVVHDTPNIQMNHYRNPSNPYMNARPNFDQQKFYQPPEVYSQPAQIYSEPAKFYSEPAKIYSEPAKIYSEPAKIYSEPAKIYSEPAKFYSEPASLHLEQNGPRSYTPWQQRSQAPSTVSTFNTTPITTVTISQLNMRIPEHQAEKNYEVDEKVSVMTDGRSHGVQESSTEKCKQENCKVGYVVKGRQYNKYRVEERTSDGFIVGEYGVVRNEDGALRGVRYTADSDASPRLIYDALMKFLQLK